MLFPERLRQLREQSGLRQRDVAKRIGVDVPMLSRYEHGERQPRRQQVVKLARIYKTDPGELVALWLASSALSTIGSDRMAARALELLDALNPKPNAPKPAKPAAGCNLVAKLGDSYYAQYHVGQALDVLAHIESESIDCVLTAPPYWSSRRHPAESITATSVEEFASQIVQVMAQVHRVLKPTGSLWLCMADAYMDRSLQGLPWRVALACIGSQGWTLRNDVVWNKQSSPFDTYDDRLRSVHEYIFHLTKQSSGFYYDDEQLRIAYNTLSKARAQQQGKPRSGATGTRYRQNIMQSDALTEQEKQNALRELDAVVAMVSSGEIPDFRMTLREHPGQVLDSGSEKARAINAQGYHFLLYNKNGGMPGDVWNIPAAPSPIERYNVMPDELCQIIIEATCPSGGIVLDPYCGLGTTCRVATSLHRRAIGIDINSAYIEQARQQARQQLPTLF